jgi:hypothetical protein
MTWIGCRRTSKTRSRVLHDQAATLVRESRKEPRTGGAKCNYHEDRLRTPPGNARFPEKVLGELATTHFCYLESEK